PPGGKRRNPLFLGVRIGAAADGNPLPGSAIQPVRLPLHRRGQPAQRQRTDRGADPKAHRGVQPRGVRRDQPPCPVEHPDATHAFHPASGLCDSHLPLQGGHPSGPQAFFLPLHRRRRREPPCNPVNCSYWSSPLKRSRNAPCPPDSISFRCATKSRRRIFFTPSVPTACPPGFPTGVS